MGYDTVDIPACTRRGVVVGVTNGGNDLSVAEHTLMLLLAVARADHLEELIKPSLARGRWLICDRFLDSTRIYQGALGKVSRPFLEGLEKLTVGDTMPDLTFILDVPAKVGLARARERRGNAAPDRFEGEGLAFHEALNAAFRELAAPNSIYFMRRCCPLLPNETWAE